jgi:hypothetical protein
MQRMQRAQREHAEAEQEHAESIRIICIDSAMLLNARMHCELTPQQSKLFQAWIFSAWQQNELFLHHLRHPTRQIANHALVGPVKDVKRKQSANVDLIERHPQLNAATGRCRHIRECHVCSCTSKTTDCMST